MRLKQHGEVVEKKKERQQPLVIDNKGALSTSVSSVLGSLSSAIQRSNFL